MTDNPLRPTAWTTEPFDRQTLLVAVHQELSAYMRFRSDPEYLYAAASIAGSGAVAWGIAAIPGAYLWAHLVGALGVIAAATTVCIKIDREHREYEKANRARAEIAQRLTQLAPGAADLIPAMWLESKSERRHYWSMAPVAVWAGVAALICIATYFGR
jgi:hypothetical protein